MPTLEFADRTWTVKTGFGGPGPCHWTPDNVWVDDEGSLHLRIKHNGETWQCAEIFSTETFQFGSFQWWVNARVDRFDPNVVLGLFPYLGPDGRNEIDIEMARWGDAKKNLGNFTVWPASADGERTHTFPVNLSGSFTTHRMKWHEKSVHFQMLNGHRNDNQNEINSWTYKPKDYEPRIPRDAMPVHMNLWLYRGLPPTDGRSVEVVITDFTYQPKA